MSRERKRNLNSGRLSSCKEFSLDKSARTLYSLRFGVKHDLGHDFAISRQFEAVSMRLFLQKVTAGKADYFGIECYVEEPIDKSLICLACFGRGTSATARLGIDWNNFSRVISGSF